jgi:hypothetical protein
MLVSCLAYYSIMKLTATYSSETSIYFQRTIWCYIPEGRTLHIHRCAWASNLTYVLLVHSYEEFCRYWRNIFTADTATLCKCMEVIICVFLFIWLHTLMWSDRMIMGGVLEGMWLRRIVGSLESGSRLLRLKGSDVSHYAVLLARDNSREKRQGTG